VHGGGLLTSQVQALLSRFPSPDLQAALHALRVGGWVSVQPLEIPAGISSNGTCGGVICPK